MNTPDAPFEEPWQAQVFAFTVALNEAGHFTWAQWASVFGPRVQQVGAESYWQVWSEALIDILETGGIASPEEVQALTERWQAAARATPHGTPIVLSAAD
ncbi:nitrile hydratase accessory protein [Thalassovita gelatinovora]|uniref:Nitrile hydratase accessory protein n=1 Tax=Thalassovita gelatinovora TaxID=53501 RepID=A0A0N7LVX5_THAGE|nr:nitrile hydratase accessory protein [Thalassovita gelatinovora]CUH67514.1 nitrile hydratase accessory protein [Thalassovita gelatinovora]SEP72647.1 nitrile hydratase accessory protein [Thalassovita gelatinovora]